MRLSPLITSRTNARVKGLRAAFGGRASQPGELVGIEGWKSVLEALRAGLQFETVAVTEAGAGGDAMVHLPSQEVLLLREDVMASVADTVSPPEVVATVLIPEEGRAGPASGVFLLLEAIQDPGNLGTLIRSAEAFGVEQVFLSPGCANPWSPKVMRASAGSVFRQAVVKRSMDEAVGSLQQRGVRVMGAVAQGEGARVSLAVDLCAPVALVIGNEGSGLSADVLALVDERIYIPCATESLNAAVAGSVLLYGVLAQRARGVDAA